MNTAELIQKLSKQSIHTTVPAKIKAVDEDAMVCDVVLLSDENQEIYDCKINAKLSPNKGLRIIPSIDSIVYITFINNQSTDAIISLYSDVEKVLIDVNDSIIINQGDNEGLIKINDLVDKLNVLEDDLNSLKNVFSSWVTVPNDGGAALKSSSTSWASSTITNTSKSDLENDKIKH